MKKQLVLAWPDAGEAGQDGCLKVAGGKRVAGSYLTRVGGENEDLLHR